MIKIIVQLDLTKEEYDAFRYMLLYTIDNNAEDYPVVVLDTLESLRKKLQEEDK